MHRSRHLRWLTALAVAALTVMPVVGSAGAAATPLSIEVLSNRADLVSGGDALVAVNIPKGVAVSTVKVRLNGTDVTKQFAKRANGRFSALLTGLKLGANTVIATTGQQTSKLTVTNHPLGGPIFSGPQIQPWYCLAGAKDAQCNRDVTFTWHYMSSTSGEFETYDPANPPTDVATTTTDEGKTVPYIVRQEIGNVDRGEYRISVLTTPDEQWTRWTGPDAWNNKIYAVHGAGCSTGHGEAPAGNVLDSIGLSRGYAVMAVGMADNNSNCNVVVQAEATMMVKEHLVEAYGDVRWLMGYGCSGGSIAQMHMANAYPGLYDGIVVYCMYPDVPINDLLDCETLLRYWNNPTKWAPGVVWPENQQAAAAGLASSSVCHAWVEAYQYPKIFDPRLGAGCDIADHEPTKIYNPSTNPEGVRCSFQDYLVNVFGLRPPERWGSVEQQIKHGFANRPFDNVGLQYGLRALVDGNISPAQFVDLNAKVGSLDIDFQLQPKRVAADAGALATAYRSGVVNETNHLDHVAIIDMPGWVPGDRYEIHDNYKSWGIRQRMDAANGHHANHALWWGIEGRFQDFVAPMSQWLTGVENDTRNVSHEQKVVDNRPEAAGDVCYYPDQGGALCNALLGPAGNPRWGAGMPNLANDVVKCRLMPLTASDYLPITFTDAQWQTLNETFPSGVCDWDRPGVGQQPTVAWQTYKAGPGGKPLGPAPTSVLVP